MAVRRIIHISDLHFSKGSKNYSLLQNEKYLVKWIDSLKEIENLDTIIISGDLVDRGGSQEAYNNVKIFINKLRSFIPIEHILCVPGNHDVNRGKLEGIKGDEGIDEDKIWNQYEKKLEYYWKFLDKVGLKPFQKSGLVSYEILENPNMVLLGLDSTDHIGLNDEFGFINIDELEKGLKIIFGENKEKYSKYKKIAVLHHRPIIYESRSQRVTENNGTEVGQYGTCDTDNWDKVRKILSDYNVHYVLTGHVHGSQSGYINSYESENDGMVYSTVGSIGINFNDELKKKLDPNTDRDLLEKLENLTCYVPLNGNHNSYNIWTYDEEKKLVQEEQYKYMVDEGVQHWIKCREKKFEEKNCKEEVSNQVATGLIKIQNKKEDYEKWVLETVREHELYKTGHFHWNDTPRLTWIETSYFFQHREEMFHIIKGMIDKYSKVFKDAGCIVGLGIKGTIILSYVRFLYPDIKCAYIPENEKEYNVYENALFEITNTTGNIVILTDVVYKGNSINAIAKKIFLKINKSNKSNKPRTTVTIDAITIFSSMDEEEINSKYADIKVHSLAKIKILECTGGGANCNIYTNKLAQVIEYKEEYDEDY